MERQEIKTLTEIMRGATMKEAALLLTQSGFLRWAEGIPLREEDFKEEERSQTTPPTLRATPGPPGSR